MDKHEIIVGNIGTVYSGNDESQATAKWNSYVLASREPQGRASGETVTWLEDGEIRCEISRIKFGPKTWMLRSRSRK